MKDFQQHMEQIHLLLILIAKYDGVFAHWFTGELRCTRGKLLKYVHGGYASSYEQDLFIDVVRGVVVAERLVVNGVAEPDATEGYTIAASTSTGPELNY